MFVDVVSVRAPKFVFNFDMFSVGGYTNAWQERRIHRSKIGGDAVGNIIFRWGRRVVKRNFGGGAVGRRAVPKACHVKKRLLREDAMKRVKVAASRLVSLANGGNAFDKN